MPQNRCNSPTETVVDESAQRHRTTSPPGHTPPLTPNVPRQRSEPFFTFSPSSSATSHPVQNTRNLTPPRRLSQLSLSAPTTPHGHSTSSLNSSPFDICEALTSHSLFSQASPELIQDLASRMHVRFFVPGDIIIEEGDQGRAMFFIVRGDCRVERAGGEVVLAELKPGQFFGEIGLLFNLPRTASVVASTRCSVLALTKQDLDSVLVNSVELKERLMREGELRLELVRRRRQEVRRRSSSSSNSSKAILDTSVPSSFYNTSAIPSILGAEDAFTMEPTDDISDVADCEELAATSGSSMSLLSSSFNSSLHIFPSSQTLHRRASSLSERGKAANAISVLPFSATSSHNTIPRPNIPSMIFPEEAPASFAKPPAGRFSPRSHSTPTEGKVVTQQDFILQPNTAVSDWAIYNPDATTNQTNPEFAFHMSLSQEPSSFLDEHDSQSQMFANNENTPRWNRRQDGLVRQSLHSMTQAESSPHKYLESNSPTNQEMQGSTAWGGPLLSPVHIPESGHSSTVNGRQDFGGNLLGAPRAFRGHGLGPRRASVAVWADPVLQEQSKKATKEASAETRHVVSSLGGQQSRFGERGDDADGATGSDESISFSSDDECGKGGIYSQEADVEVEDVEDVDFNTILTESEQLVGRTGIEIGNGLVEWHGNDTPEKQNKLENGLAPFSAPIEKPSAPEVEITFHDQQPLSCPLPKIVAPSSRSQSQSRTHSRISSFSEANPISPLLKNEPKSLQHGHNIPQLLHLPDSIIINIFNHLPFTSIIIFRRVSRRARKFVETFAPQILPSSLDLSPYHKKIDDDTLLNILVLWVLPNMSFVEATKSRIGDGKMLSKKSSTMPTNPTPTPTPTKDAFSATPSPTTPNTLQTTFSTARSPTSPAMSQISPNATTQQSQGRPRHLHRLSLRNCWSLTNRGISTIGPTLPYLTSLDLQGCWDISGPGLVSLCNATGLRSIDLSNCRKIDNSSLISLLIGCPEMREVRVGYCKLLTGDVFAGGWAVWGRVRKLNLQRCTGIGDLGFSYWKSPQNDLTHNAKGEGVSDLNMDVVEEAAKTKKMLQIRTSSEEWDLEELILADCSFLTDAAAANIAGACHQLRILSLSFCCALTESVASFLVAGTPHLKVLDLSFCGTAVSDESLAELAKGLQELEALGIRGCIRVTEAGLRAVVLESKGLNASRDTAASNASTLFGSDVSLNTLVPKIDMQSNPKMVMDTPTSLSLGPPPYFSQMGETPNVVVSVERDEITKTPPPTPSPSHPWFSKLRLLNATQCKGVSTAAIEDMERKAGGKWRLITGNILEEKTLR